MSKKSNQYYECLERMRRGEDLESCLKDYPKEAEELRVLLKTAGGMTRLAETIKPRPEFITQTQAKLRGTYHVEYCSWKAHLFGILKPVGRFAAASALAVVILAVVFTGGFSLSVLASENTMPGETLYPVKLATEQVRLAFAFSDQSKVDYLTRFAEARAAEIVYEAERGDDARVEAALERLERNLAKVEKIVGPSEVPSAVAASEQIPPGLQKIENTVKDSSAKVKDKLKDLKEPDPEKKDKIAERAEKAYDKALEAIEKAKSDKAK